MSADSEFDVPTAGQSETVLAPLPANHLYTSIRRRRRRCCWCCSVPPRDVARCAGEEGEDGANGGVGNGSARRVAGRPPRRGSGHDKMFSWDAGCQRWLPVPNALKAQKITASHCSSTRRPARANSSGLLLDSEDEQGYQLEDGRSSHTFAVSLHVSVKKH